MNIEDMIWNGASEEEINEALSQLRFQRTLKMEEERLAREAQKQKDTEQAEKEALRAEGRAYLINAMIAYSEAFDLDDGEWEQEDIDKLEQLLIKLEDMIPVYLKLIEMQGNLDQSMFGFGFKM